MVRNIRSHLLSLKTLSCLFHFKIMYFAMSCLYYQWIQSRIRRPHFVGESLLWACPNIVVLCFFALAWVQRVVAPTASHHSRCALDEPNTTRYLTITIPETLMWLFLSNTTLYSLVLFYVLSIFLIHAI